MSTDMNKDKRINQRMKQVTFSENKIQSSTRNITQKYLNNIENHTTEVNFCRHNGTGDINIFVIRN